MDKVVHFEIPFDDKKRAMKFYTEAFGWKLTDMAEMSYVMAETTAVDEKQRAKDPGAINGGLFPRPKEERRLRGARAQEHSGRRRQSGDAKDTDPWNGRVRPRGRYRGKCPRPIRRREWLTRRRRSRAERALVLDYGDR